MEAIEFLTKKEKMCQYIIKTDGNCKRCSFYKDNTQENLNCNDYLVLNPIKAVETVEQWDKKEKIKV